MKRIQHINLLILFLAMITNWSCNRDEIFEREQYKTVLAILSDDGFNIFSEEIKFKKEGGMSDGYIAASCGGALPTTTATEIHLIEDESLITNYNSSNFDQDVERYAHHLNPERYSIEEPIIHIPAGERNGRMKVKVNIDGLSPDSTYFIPLRVKNISAYEMNQKKGTVLFKVQLKNYYSTTKSDTWYDHRGIMSGINTMVQKRVYPVAYNEVRTFAGIKAHETKESLFNRWSIRLIIDEENNVTIRPWDTTAFGMKVKQLDGDPDYPNIFKIQDTGFKTYKTFLLHYEFVNPDDLKTYQIKEELRLEFNERNEDND